MRVACFSPLPPRKSGIADYSAALLPRLANQVDLEVFVEDPGVRCDSLRVRPHKEYRAADFEITLYQAGNNPDHVFVYDAAIEQPGVVVLHEFNLHHLIAAATIRRGDWDGYLREAEYNGGAKEIGRAHV